MTAPFGTLLSVVTDALDAREYKYLVHGETTVSLRIHDRSAAYDIFLTANDTNGMVACYCRLGSFVPIDRRPAVAEAIARANFRLCYGGFDLDFSDGELRYRVGFDTEGVQCTSKTIDNLISTSLFACERYHDALMRIAFGDAEPEAAIACVQ